jgi:phytoene desaturase
LQEHGAELHLNSSVEKIEVENKKVKRVWTTDGKSYEADLVVSNADPVRVYRDMIDQKHRRKHKDWRLNMKSHSMSLFVAYFGTNKTYDHLAHHTILLGPRYKGLLHDIFSKKVLADDFSLYLHAPTRSDASMAPPGHECFYVLSPVPNNLSKIDWKTEAPRYKEKIYKWLESKQLPGLTDSMVTDLHIDPDYFEGKLQSEKGAAFGIEPSFRQSAYFRFHSKSEDVDGLYFCGANVHPGAGLPGVLNSAKVLERQIPSLKTSTKPSTVTIQRTSKNTQSKGLEL